MGQACIDKRKRGVHRTTVHALRAFFLVTAAHRPAAMSSYLTTLRLVTVPSAMRLTLMATPL